LQLTRKIKKLVAITRLRGRIARLGFFIPGAMMFNTASIKQKYDKKKVKT